MAGEHSLALFLLVLPLSRPAGAAGSGGVQTGATQGLLDRFLVRNFFSKWLFPFRSRHKYFFASRIQNVCRASVSRAHFERLLPLFSGKKTRYKPTIMLRVEKRSCSYKGEGRHVSACRKVKSRLDSSMFLSLKLGPYSLSRARAHSARKSTAVK